MSGSNKEKLDTITNRIHTEADEHLRREIDKALDHIRKALGYGSTHSVVVWKHNNKEVTLQTSTYVLIEVLKAKAFEVQRDKFRKKRLDAFFEKVSALGEQFEELQAMIEGGGQ